MTIHVVGNVCVDTTFRLPRLPQPGETLNAAVAGEGLGGKGANQAVAAARTGASVVLWAPVGKDVAGDHIRGLLADEIADLRLTRLHLPCDRSVILVDDAGENLIVTAAACAAAYDPLAFTALQRTWQSGDMLLMQGNLDAGATAACLQAAHAAGLFTVLNPSPLPVERLDLTTVSLLIANRPEAVALTGETDAGAAAGRLLALGAGHVVVTLGGDGALLRDAITNVHLPAAKAKAVDTSGAGDCFAGTLAGYLSLGVPLHNAAQIAIAAAGLSVGRAGTLASFPARAEISAFAKSIKPEHV